MREKMTIARPYAQAVLRVAMEEKDLAGWSAMLAALERLVASVSMRSVLMNPAVKAEALSGVVVDALAQELNQSGKNLVAVLAAAGRLGLIPEISRLYGRLRGEVEGVADVSIVSAYELTDAQRSSLAALMAGRLGKKIALDSEVDSDLMGGIMIRTRDTVTDASVRGRLQAVAAAITGR